MSTPVLLHHGSRFYRVESAVSSGGLLQVKLNDRRSVGQGLKIWLNCFGQESSWIVARSANGLLTLVPSKSDSYPVDQSSVN